MPETHSPDTDHKVECLQRLATLAARLARKVTDDNHAGAQRIQAAATALARARALADTLLSDEAVADSKAAARASDLLATATAHLATPRAELLILADHARSVAALPGTPILTFLTLEDLAYEAREMALHAEFSGLTGDTPHTRATLARFERLAAAYGLPALSDLGAFLHGSADSSSTQP
jgi:hypothetical protein